MTRGSTLLEVLVVSVVGAIIVSSITFAFGMAARFQTTLGQADAEAMALRHFEHTIANLLTGAVVREGDPLTYFVLADDFSEDVEPGALTFTTDAGTVSTAYLQSEGDFETLHEAFGPQGGLAEVELSQTPFIGSQPGAYLRRQQPADGDLMQGGTERALMQNVQELWFECWDGLGWTNYWDTRIGEQRLPAAVRVHYTLAPNGETRSFVVQIPGSDVTDLRPYQQEPLIQGGIE